MEHFFPHGWAAGQAWKTFLGCGVVSVPRDGPRGGSPRRMRLAVPTPGAQPVPFGHETLGNTSCWCPRPLS